MHVAVTGFLFCRSIFGTNSAGSVGYVCSIGLACSYDRSRIKHSDIFRRIFALAKSKRSRINRPGYFSCFFHYFGSYAHTSNVSGVLSTRLWVLAFLPFFFPLLRPLVSPHFASPSTLSPLYLVAFSFFRKLCGLRYQRFCFCLLIQANFPQVYRITQTCDLNYM